MSAQCYLASAAAIYRQDFGQVLRQRLVYQQLLLWAEQQVKSKDELTNAMNSHFQMSDDVAMMNDVWYERCRLVPTAMPD